MIFESYNTVIAGSYERCFLRNGYNGTVKELRYNEERLKQCLEEDIKRWENKPVNGLGRLTPAVFFEEIHDVDYAVEVFKLGSVLCNEDLPELFIDKLKTLGDDTVCALKLLARSKPSGANSEDDILTAVSAVRVLGKLKPAGVALYLVEMLKNVDSPEEIYVEAVKDALIDVGRSSIEPIMELLQNAEALTGMHEHLLIALSETGRNNKTGDVYKCIKSAFMKMEDKRIGAMCLGRYGDTMAVPALRGYAEKNLDRIDIETFYDIKSAVHMLGGNMDDLTPRNSMR